MYKWVKILSALFLFSLSIHAQPVSCPGSDFYLYDGVFIKVFNTSLPPSATNPATTSIPSLGTLGAGLALMPNINGGTVTPTFYTTSGGTYWYWDGGAWVNTFHTTGHAGAMNIAGCNGSIYNLVGSNGEIYVYNGNGNGTLLTTLPSYTTSGPYDLVTDCNCNFYALNTTLPNQSLSLYNSSGNLICSYSLSGMPNANGGGGFAIIGNTVYVKTNLSNGFYIGTIGGGVVSFTQVSAFSGSPNDFASCPVCNVTPTLSGLSISQGGLLSCNSPVVNVSVTASPGNTLGLSYIWSGPGIISSNSTSSVSVNLPGTYSCVVSTNACPPQQTTLTSVVNTNSTNVMAVISPSGNICISASASLQLQVTHTSANESVTWYGGILPGNPNGNTVAVNNPGTYTVVVVDVPSGCTNSDVVTVAHTPTINVTLSSATVCQQAHNGSPNNMIMAANGASNYSLATSANFSVSTTGTAIACIPKPPFSSVNSIASATLTGYNLFCADTVITSFLIIYNPVVSASVLSGSICPSGSQQITVSGASSYSWSPVPGLNTYNGPTVMASPSVSSVYSFYGSSQGCNSVSKQATITVQPLPTLTLSQQSATICSGSTLSLSANGTATSYTWLPTAAFVNPNLPLVTTIPGSAQVYTVVAAINSCTSSSQVSVNITAPPSLSLSLSGQTVCANAWQNSPNTITLNPQGATTYTVLPGSNFSVSNPNGPLINIIPTVTTFTNVTGYVTLHGSSGVCQVSLTKSFVIVANPVVLVTPSSTDICIGDQQVMTLSGAHTYSWISASPDFSILSAVSAVANPTISSVYSVFGSQNGCFSEIRNATLMVSPIPTVAISQAAYTVCSGVPLVLNASGNALNYNWFPASQVISANGSTATIQTSVNTLFTVVASYNSCTSTAITTVSAISLPSISVVAEPPQVCSGLTTTLKASGALNYVWLPDVSLKQSQGNQANASPLKHTIYSVNGFNGLCTGHGTVLVKTIDWPEMEMTEAPSSVCRGNTLALSAAGAETYTWLPIEAIQVISSQSFIIARPYVSTNYTIIGANSMGSVSCPQQMNYSVSVVTPPEISTTGSVVICSGYKTTIKAFGASNFVWYPEEGLNSINEQAVVVQPTASTIYTVEAYDLKNCSSTSTLYVMVSAKPWIFASRDTSYSVNEPIFISARSNGTVSWIAGEAIDCPACPETRVSPLSSGCYVAEATNEYNCTNQDQVCLNITRDFNVYLPNSFTPNNDGNNDMFFVYGDNLTAVKLEIFNRWGELIFKSDNQTLGWDGRDRQGELCPAGIYVYQLSYKGLNPKLLNKSGSINLIR